MKKSFIYAIGLSAVFCGCLALQSCADTQTTYTTTSDPYYEPQVASETTTTTYTTTAEPDDDSVVGSTVHAAGTIIAAPFRLVGDALSIVF
jgi:hypothetical protein